MACGPGRNRRAAAGRLRPYLAAEIEPGPDRVSDDDLLAHARARGSTICHPSGTCMMGLAANPMAVVDPELRVPTVVSGNANAACTMIGEKCADPLLAAR